MLHSKSAQFSLSYHKLEGDASGAYEFDFENHIFDLETWTCSIKNLPSFRGVSTISQQCTAEMASRTATVIMFILALALFVVVWWDTRQNQALIVAGWRADPMTWDDEDDCELVNFVGTRQLRRSDLRPKSR